MVGFSKGFRKIALVLVLICISCREARETARVTPVGMRCPTARRSSPLSVASAVSSAGVVSTVVGGYLLLAGLRRAPSEAKGTRGAIQSLGQNPFGLWILALIALGLGAYGVHTLVESRYRKLAVG